MRVGIAITVSPEALKAAKEFAEKNGLTLSALIELLIREKFQLSPVKLEVKKNEANQ